MAPTSSINRTSEIPGFVDRIIRPMTTALNPLILRIAGGWWFPMFSLLRHQGHRTGRMYSTPVTAMPRGGWFWLGLTFGRNSGWAKNVLAAGECTVRYRGTEYHLVEPALMDGAAVRKELPPMMGFAVSLIGMSEVLRMRPVSR